jgi:hypothetical protein
LDLRRDFSFCILNYRLCSRSQLSPMPVLAIVEQDCAELEQNPRSNTFTHMDSCPSFTCSCCNPPHAMLSAILVAAACTVHGK